MTRRGAGIHIIRIVSVLLPIVLATVCETPPERGSKSRETDDETTFSYLIPVPGEAGDDFRGLYSEPIPERKRILEAANRMEKAARAELHRRAVLQKRRFCSLSPGARRDLVLREEKEIDRQLELWRNTRNRHEAAVERILSDSKLIRETRERALNRRRSVVRLQSERQELVSGFWHERLTGLLDGDIDCDTQAADDIRLPKELLFPPLHLALLRFHRELPVSVRLRVFSSD